MNLARLFPISLLISVACPSAFAAHEEFCDAAAFFSVGERASRRMVLDSGIEITGSVVSPITRETAQGTEVIYVKTQGPTTLGLNRTVLPGQGVEQHAHGFSSPVGRLASGKNLATISLDDARMIGIEKGNRVVLKYESGVIVDGEVTGWVRSNEGFQILSFKDCKVTYRDQILFDPSWGEFDMAIGSRVLRLDDPNPPHLSRYLAAAQAGEKKRLVLDSGIEISGPLANPITREGPQGTEILYVKTQGPTTLGVNRKVLAGQGVEQHAHGFSSPVGVLENGKNLVEMSVQEAASVGIVAGKRVTLRYASGVVVDGQLKSWVRSRKGFRILSFVDCKVTYGDQVLFDPSWGDFDMTVGSRISAIE